MSKTIVSIISEQTIPNYLFIKEMFLPGDTLMFISSKKMSKRIGWIKNTLDWNNCCMVDIILDKDGDEEKNNVMNEKITQFLSPSCKYYVNLTGGTKFMALVVQNIFERYNSSFYYIPYPKNQIITLSNSKIDDISLRVSIREYLSLYGEKIREPKNPSIDSSYTKSFLTTFLNGLKNNDFEIINKLRAYRNYKKGIVITEIEAQENSDKKPRIENLTDFLNSIKYPYHSDHLTHYDIQYLTGGWFEEYVYHTIKERVHPNDILLGVNIEKTNNDLDVVFTIGNKLYVIECKTGVEKEMMLKEIVYKASALKSELLGLSAKSYIFALSEDNERWETAALNMGIEYCGRSYFQEENNLYHQLDKIIKTAFN